VRIFNFISVTIHQRFASISHVTKEEGVHGMCTSVAASKGLKHLSLTVTENDDIDISFSAIDSASAALCQGICIEE
jgi:hypothetical protein